MDGRTDAGSTPILYMYDHFVRLRLRLATDRQITNEPRHEKIYILHMQKEWRRLFRPFR